MEPNANISITRTSDNKMHIRIMDEPSRGLVVEVLMSLEDFTLAITGLSYIEVEATYGKLDRIGKTKVVEKRSVITPLMGFNREDLKDWLLENCQEEGWIIDPYLGSQNSISYESNFAVLNYSVYKFVEVK